jgi:hypothetical protein
MSYLLSAPFDVNEKEILVRIHAVSFLIYASLATTYWIYKPDGPLELTIIKSTVIVCAFASLVFTLQTHYRQESVEVANRWRWVDFAVSGIANMVSLVLIIGQKNPLILITVGYVYAHMQATYHVIELALPLVPSKRDSLTSVLSTLSAGSLAVLALIVFYYTERVTGLSVAFAWSLALSFIMYEFIIWGFSLSHTIATGVFQGAYFVHTITITKVCQNVTFFLTAFTCILQEQRTTLPIALSDIILIAVFVPLVTLLFSVFTLYPTSEQVVYSKKNDFFATPGAAPPIRVKFQL